MRGPDNSIVSRAENIVTWHKINEFTRNQTNSCYYSVCNRISRNVQGNRFLLSSFVKCGCQYSDRPSISPLYTPIYFPGVQTKYSPSRPDLGTMSLSLMFIQVLGCKLIGNLLSSHNDYSDSHWSVSRMVVVVHITGSSSRPDMSSLLAGMYTMKVRYTRDTELSTAQAMHRHSEQHTTFSGPEMRWRIMRNAARDELGFMDLALSDTSSLISSSMEWAKTIKVYLRLSRAASLIPSHSFYKSSPLVHFQCFDYSWWDFKSSGAFPG